MTNNTFLYMLRAYAAAYARTGVSAADVVHLLAERRTESILTEQETKAGVDKAYAAMQKSLSFIYGSADPAFAHREYGGLGGG